jgi:hypothetical protein
LTSHRTGLRSSGSDGSNEGVVKPRIQGTRFGSITVDGEEISHDVLVLPSGKVRKRKKKLSKAVYGTSHTISLAEAEHVYDRGESPRRLIIGTGQHGMVHLSPEADHFLQQKGCAVFLAPTPEAIDTWNAAGGKVAGLFHVTC